ncbi:hypothetical protein FrCorBMG51_22045 [Protofrankia coriariae]|uniref:Uncharacterized protein n=2 Tax=Protofrankia coriariae TaxID=1562887 RepID=A0ABR5EZM5_9ACTN|nr:hypothetical protein FrCorBMG51_22045 [Protofrankia coriariae]
MIIFLISPTYDVEEVCVALLGLDPARDDHDSPYSSKHIHVRSRLFRTLPELTELARRIIKEYGSDELETILSQLGPTGVSGEPKNLIFAANGPKPRLVLRDAINNVIEIVENAEHCLVYDRPLGEMGLSWRALTNWWTQTTALLGDE